MDEKLANNLWPGQPILGKRLKIHQLNRNQRIWVEIVGVVEHVRHVDLGQDSRMTVYFPHGLQAAYAEMTVVVRSSSDAQQLSPLIRREVKEMDPELPVFGERSMDEYIDRALAPARFTLVLIAAFAATALVLASVGLYGLISSMVRQRTRDIGILMAFGARRRDILGWVLGRGALLVLGGVALGVCAQKIDLLRKR